VVDAHHCRQVSEGRVKDMYPLLYIIYTVNLSVKHTCILSSLFYYTVLHRLDWLFGTLSPSPWDISRLHFQF